ncbi:MAG: hypothetical protein HPY51_12440 [Candidatus Omnitrophica bacterium]|nr:hypothetical protein [Candidatus Omnitrophota bacterium]
MGFLPPLPPGTFSPDDLLEWNQPTARVPWWTWLGGIVILVSEVLLFFQIEPVYTHFTPIAWWGYILLLDGLIKKRRGVSFLPDKPRLFGFLAVVSALWWLVFEFYNCYLENWVYVGLPENLLHRYVGYLIAFATIIPAVLSTYEFFLTYWPSRDVLDFSKKPKPLTLKLLFLIGFLCVTVPLFIPVREIRHYLFGFVWIGYVLLLEPLAYASEGYSLLRLWTAGARRLVWLMLGSGAVCGLLWEFWNYWAGAKWFYTVPVFPAIRYFEMPLPGFLGFLPFAWECLMLSVFTSLIFQCCPLGRSNGPLAKRVVHGARALLGALALVFVLAVTIQPGWLFPVQGIRFSTPAVKESEETRQLSGILDKLRVSPESWNELLSEPVQAKVGDNKIFYIAPWPPDLVSRENLFLLGRVQKMPGAWRCIDPLLRDYAVATRFHGAGLR